MGQIYSKATEVLIWLGEESEHSREIMLYLRRIGQRFVDRGGEIREPRHERSPENDAIWADVTSDPDLMERVHLIWTRPWFSRRWIIQEMALAHRPIVHCGDVSMDWDVLYHAGQALAQLKGDGGHFFHSREDRPLQLRGQALLNALKLQEIRKQIWAPDTQNSNRQMFECLNDARAFGCRDAKDRVFALLGIFNYGRDNPFTIDYGCSEAEVFEAFARYCLQNGKTVDILSFAGETNHASIEERLNLPTWVPDWRLPFRSSVDMLHGFRAGHRLSSSLVLEDSSRELLVRGKLVDRILGFIEPVESFRQPGQTAEWRMMDPAHVPLWYAHVEQMFRTLFEVSYRERRPYIGGGDVWEALARTFIIDRTDVIFDYELDHPERAARSRHMDLGPFYEEFDGFRTHMLNNLLGANPYRGSPENPAPLTLISLEQMEYNALAVSYTENRTFFITQKGYIGLGPPGIREGDVITILAGSSVPYILRPLSEDFHIIGERGRGPVTIRREAYFQMPNGERKDFLLREREERFKLVGEGYVQGLMKGEVWGIDHAFFEEFRLV
jgi:hypothetical protein